MTSSNNQIYNDIMADGSKERPPMLAPGSYAQWKSWFMRYVDTKPNKELLIKTIYEGPYVMTKITHPDTLEDCDIPRNGIRNDIYSAVDAFPNAQEMWIDISCLQQGESITIQDVKTKLFLKFSKFTSRDVESIESYYTKFYRMMNEIVRNKLKVDNMQNVNTSLRTGNDRNTRQFVNPLTVTVTGNKETVGNQEILTADSRPTYDAEPLKNVPINDGYNVIDTKRLHFEKPESINDIYVVETVDINVILDSLDT
ncbi:hypothetical protein Tco_1169771 [Tanacetum coccineum]